MVAHISPHKLGEHDPGPRHRLRMCELAVQDAEGVSACGLELARPAPSYTVDTLSALHQRHPQAELTFIVGADTASTLGTWREPAALLELARLAVAERDGYTRAGVLEAIGAVPGASSAARERVSFLAMGALDVSSSQVRAMVARAEPVAYLVGEAVAGYIAEHGLYATAQAGAP